MAVTLGGPHREPRKPARSSVWDGFLGICDFWPDELAIALLLVLVAVVAVWILAVVVDVTRATPRVVTRLPRAVARIRPKRAV